jgi:S-(hydroxymethyl)glutathione dehydrogenase / alcohol dehydrogenase
LAPDSRSLRWSWLVLWAALYSRMYLDGRFELDAQVSAEISLDQIESGYQKLADPEITRVVITRF